MRNLSPLLFWIPFALMGQLALGQGSATAPSSAARSILAGAYARNIDPQSFPVWVSGGIVAGKGERVVDSLFARSLVIESGEERLAVCVVDSLGVPQEIVERAKELVAAQTPLRPHQILISATHSHSAPALMGAHGTPVQEDYAAAMPAWIAESIVEAYRRRVAARVGVGVSNADRYIHCRHWIMEPGHAGALIPFTGREGNLAVMNPGFDDPYKLRQTSEVDRSIPILSLQTAEGRPLAVLASFCTHYAGAPALSSDYFGVVCKELAKQLSPDDPDAFVGIMANGTSGDANCIDFSRPAKPFTYQEVGNYITSRIMTVLPSIEYSSNADLDSALEKITAKVRLASPEELQQATAYVQSKMGERLPANIEENYARETVLLSQLPPTRDLPLQVLRVGNLAIVGYPNETFNSTGLAVRAASPFQVTMNIGLANDLAGYLPPADQFPLGGYTSWRARTSCLEEPTEARVVQTLSAMVAKLAPDGSYSKKPHTSDKDSSKGTQGTVVSHAGPNTALSPKESLRMFELDSQQRIELVAHEPNLIDPVAMRFDDAGNLWVVEMSDYPTNRGPDGLGRIRVLRDENLDGLYESAEVFADRLLFPTGLQLHRDGVLVTVGGKLLFLRDTDGDRRADTKEEWLQGFAEENPQLRVNDPDFGMDGKLYLANGLRSAKVQVGSVGQVEIASSDLRLDWQSGHSERVARGVAIAGPSQFGMTWDRFGNRYFCSNRNPCDAVVMEPWISSSSPLVGLAPMTMSVLPTGEKSTVRPLVSAWTTSNLHAGQFTAACGVLISRSQHLPLASLGNALTCEPTGSLVHRIGLGRVQGRTVPEEPERTQEWLASRDPWFRPVNLEEGPDGGIYIVDMHRAVIEHPDWVPEELKHRVDERWGDDCGRIYRVVRRDAPGMDPVFQELRQRPLASRSSEELVRLLCSPRAWIQKTAARLLAERLANFHANGVTSPERDAIQRELQDRVDEWIVTKPANKTAGTGGTAGFESEDLAQGILQGLWILQSLLETKIGEPGGLQAKEKEQIEAHYRRVFSALNQPRLDRRDPAWRGAILRMLVEFSSTEPLPPEWIDLAIASVQSGPREEALACAWLLSKKPFESVVHTGSEWLDSSVQRGIESADDPMMLMALAGMNRSQLDRWVVRWMEEATKRLDDRKMVRSFALVPWKRLVSSVAKPDNPTWTQARDAWLADALKRLELAPQSETDRRLSQEPALLLQLAIAQGIGASADRGWLGKQRALWEGWLRRLEEPDWSSAVRSELIETLGLSIEPDQSELCSKGLQVALEKSHAPEVRRLLVGAWSKHPDPSDQTVSGAGVSRIADWIVAAYDKETPAMRQAMFQAVRSRPERLARWLDGVESQSISLRGLDASQLQTLKQVSGDLQPRINKLIEGRIQGNRQALVDRYMPALSGPSDQVRGKQLFAQHCAACHRIDGVGVAVGPDISDSRTQTSAQLLVSILDPNRAIDNNYFRVTVQMNDGTIHDGIIVEESKEHLTLKNQQNPALVLSKSEIEGVKSSGVSLMPEGIESQLDERAVADLIGYIKNWRYVGGESPVVSGSR